MSCDDDEERIAAAKAAADAKREQEIEDHLAETGAIRIDGHNPRFRPPKPWEQGYDPRIHE